MGKKIAPIPAEKAKSRLEYYRRLRGLSQDQLAQLSGVHKNTIWSYEHGMVNPKIDTLQKLCKALNVSLEEMIV